MDNYLEALVNPELETEETMDVSKQDDEEYGSGEEVAELAELLGSFDWEGDNIEKAAQILRNPYSTINELYDAVTRIKKILTTSRESVFSVGDEVIDQGILGSIIQILHRTDTTYELTLSCAFCMTNIAAGTDEQSTKVVELGGVPCLLNLFSSEQYHLRRQALFCLANIAGSTTQMRLRLVTTPEYVERLTMLLNKEEDDKLVELIAWNIRNMCILGGPSFLQLRPAIIALAMRIISVLPDEETIIKLVKSGTASICSAQKNTACWNAVNLYRGKVGSNTAQDSKLSCIKFCSEVLWKASQEYEGSKTLTDLHMPLIILHLAKFSSNNTTRNYALMTLHNIALFSINEFDTIGPVAIFIRGTAEIVTDTYSYLPENRELALAALYNMASAASKDRMTIFTKPCIHGRYAYVGTPWTTDPQSGSHYVVTSRSSYGEEYSGSVHLISVLDVAYRCYSEVDGVESVALKFHAARLIMVVLSKSYPIVLEQLLSPSLIETLLEFSTFILQLADDPQYYGNTQANVHLDLLKSPYECICVWAMALKIGEKMSGGGFSPVARCVKMFGSLRRLEGYIRRRPEIDNALRELSPYVNLFE